MQDVQAGSSNATIEVSCWDKVGAARVPTSATYKTLGWEDGGYASKTELRALTSLTPLAAEMEISLDATDTTLIDAANSFEWRRVCVYVDEAFWDSYTFRVVKPSCS